MFNNNQMVKKGAAAAAPKIQKAMKAMKAMKAKNAPKAAAAAPKSKKAMKTMKRMKAEKPHGEPVANSIAELRATLAPGTRMVRTGSNTWETEVEEVPGHT